MDKISKKNYYVLGAMISALVVGHFALQLFFIATENWSFDGSLGRVDTPVEEVLSTSPDVAFSEPVTQRPPTADVVSDQRETSRRPVPITQSQTAAKEKAVSKARSARLRRAEKILTGF